MSVAQQDVPIAPDVSPEPWTPWFTAGDYMMHMPSMGYWTAGMPQLTPHSDFPPEVLIVLVDALQSYVNSTREQAEAKKRQLTLAGWGVLLEENPPKAPAPVEPPGAFADQDSSHPGPPTAPPPGYPFVETGTAASGRVQPLGGDEAKGNMITMPVPSMKLASTIEPSGTDPGPLKRAQTEQWKSKVQTFELKGATLAVFSVHENHIVNSSS
eukprot:CAMPEP_0172707830 /NCGR_PEP_ID=MMETSP1074-20121228/50204_1 /TAXON_ID=2916 /ORGANISM="Ceratium fusus, Strain PA161109" /LENGTH=211 /DNA_ID=CAMNT_0013530697 /DNA_START=18 /DNA_END=649 /DNA_ORIENTATION=-